MTFDHWLKEGRERARWLTKSILGRGSKEWKSSGAGVHFLSGQQEQGSRCQEAVMERVKGMKGPGGSPVRLGGM